ncbi:peptidase inhibitor family I36 protein [Kitasatospora sp. NPDC059327]|uniref:peptidase inhibitor family I36 protein n=1 Tax=Kitasatospora sp. NPDC059327 TaxID=3346803 RepID=UPI00369BAF4F
MLTFPRSRVLRLAAGALTVASLLGAQAAGARPRGPDDTRPLITALTPGQRADLQHAVDDQLAGGRGGRQSAANEVTYPDGAVVVLPLPGQAQAPAWSGDTLRRGAAADADWKQCPHDPAYYCFYQDINWGGRRLQFAAVYEQTPVSFTDYGFQDQTSSWVNTTRNLSVIVDMYEGADRWRMLWKEAPGSLSASVQEHDQADRFWAVRE